MLLDALFLKLLGTSLSVLARSASVVSMVCIVAVNSLLSVSIFETVVTNSVSSAFRFFVTDSMSVLSVLSFSISAISVVVRPQDVRMSSVTPNGSVPEVDVIEIDSSSGSGSSGFRVGCGNDGSDESAVLGCLSLQSVA